MPNTLSPLLDLPFFELCNQAPVATSALSAMTTVEDGASRFIYYISGSSFYRYDTQADTWQQLANPNVAPVTLVALRYTGRRGLHGRVLAATSTTLTIPGVRGPALDGETVSIEFGTGSGQERTLTYVGETIHDAGVLSSASTTVLTDSTKKWRVNQWAGYTVGITFGTDATHYRKVLYNDATTLTVADVNLLPHDPWNNQAYVAASPYALPVATAGAQSHYVISSAQFNVTAWDTIPDRTSFFTTLTGGIYMISSAAAAPFFTLQYYDILNDVWQTKTCPQGLIGAALGTDIAIERTGKIGGSALTGTATGGTSRTLVDSTKALEFDRYRNYRIYITGGTGRGQSRRIVAHNATTFSVTRNWAVIPDATSTYAIWGDYDRLYMTGNGAAAVYAYSPENDYWMQGHSFDDGVTSSITATMAGWTPLGVSTGVRIAAGVRAINPTPTAAGSAYSLGDILTHSTGGTGCQIRVTGITSTGAVTSLELIHSGTATGFTLGTGKTVTGGTGTGLTFEITNVGATALITLATAHWLETGQSVTFAGCAEAAWNAAHTIIGCPSTTTFCVSTPATANMTATLAQSATLIVDVSKSWIPGEHVGRVVHVMVAGQSPTSQIRWITANTETTLTVATVTAAVNGTSKYVIYDSKAFGIDSQRKETGMRSEGWATGGSTTTLVDSSKSWIPGQWTGYFFRVEAGTGYGSGRIQITGNTADTLTFATQSFTPNTTTRYDIADAWGVASAGSATTIVETGAKNWSTNQWGGKRVRILGGTGAGQEAVVQTNTSNTLTTGTITAPDATSVYAILGAPARGAGTQLIWAWGATDAAKKGRFMFSPRGGGTNQIDIYDLTTAQWDFGLPIRPQNDLFTTGSSYAYDGGDNIYLGRSTTGTVMRIFQLDIDRREMTGKATTTFLQGTAHIGNFMEIAELNGNKYLYNLQTTGTLLARALLF
jgi:hypothetical protein